MSSSNDECSQPRRRFLGTAALTMAAAQLGMIGGAAAQSAKTKPSNVPVIKPGTNTSFKSLKQINAGLLNVGYAEDGPSDGPAVVLLHGWPYDIHSYVDVAPLLAAKGYRVIVPYLRGFGTTRFLASDTFRNGQQSVVALDIIALMMPSRSRRRLSRALIGERGRPTSWQYCGLSAARASFPWAAI